MKICQINNCYNIGSTGKIVAQVHKYLLGQGVESIVCSATNSDGDDKKVFKYGNQIEKYICAGLTRITGNRYGYAFFQTNKLLRILNKENPDIVHIHCANCYDTNIYKLLNWCAKNNKKIVITEHAEYYYTGNCSHAFECDKWKSGCGKCQNLNTQVKSKVFDLTARYWQKMKNAFDKCDNLNVVAVSDWVKNRSMMSPILAKHKHFTINNGVDTSIFKWQSSNLKELLEIEINNKIILHITPNFFSEIKGGNYVLDIARLMPHIQFIVVGQAKPNYSPANIIWVPKTDNQLSLAKYYSMADITLLTSKRETYSMVVVESLVCGTPVVGFEAGAPETITIQEYSDFVEYGNTQKLVDALESWLYKEVDKHQVSEKATNKYNKDKMCQSYYELYRKI